MRHGPLGVAKLVVAALALACLAPALAQAAPQTFVANKASDHAPNGCTHSDCTLREAVIAANVHPGPDAIKLLGKTYTLALPGTGEDAAANGDLDLTQSVRISGKGAGPTVVDGGGPTVGEAAFEVISGAARLSGLTVRHSVSGTEDAGITLRTGSSLHMSNARVVHNVETTSTGRAGIQAYNGTGTNFVLKHVTVAHNTGGTCCAGVETDASANFRHVTVAHNSSPGCCNGINAGYGSPSGRARFTDVRVIDNTGPGCCNGLETSSSLDGWVLRRVVVNTNDGSGCCQGLDLAASGKLRDVVVSGNDAPSCCNGIEISGGNLADVVVNDNDGAGCCQGLEIGSLGGKVVRTTVSGNDDSVGPCTGICTVSAMRLTNVTVSGNSAAGEGAGIDVLKGAATLNNVTVSRNHADADNTGGGNGGGILVKSDPSASLALQNSIVAGNTVGSTGSGPDCSGTLTSHGHNLIGDTSGCTIATTGSDIVGVSPLLAPLRDNGGFTKTHALKRHSKAIDHGSPKKPGSGGQACDRHDQRGIKRPQGPRCDIGAYELKKHHHH